MEKPLSAFNDLMTYESTQKGNNISLSDIKTEFILNCIKSSQRKRLYFIKKQNGIKVL